METFFLYDETTNDYIGAVLAQSVADAEIAAGRKYPGVQVYALAYSDM